MKSPTRNRFLPGTVSAIAIFAIAPAPAAAAEEVDEVTELTRPDSTIRAGVGYVSRDNLRFSQYTGLRDEAGYGLLDFNVVQRDDATGTWMRLDGRDVGFENRELRFEHSRQGDWGYFLEFNQMPRYEPYTISTAVTGIGTPDLNVPATATPGNPVELKTRRDTLGLGFNKSLTGDFDVQVRFRQQEKTGERLFARGTTGAAGNFQFTPEPIDSTIQQVDATLGYTGEKLQFSAGYYGTAYNNHNPALNITEIGGSTPLSTFTPIGLPPDNESHQLSFAGGYNFTPATRSTFKLAYGRATQNDTFITPTLRGNTSLDGRIDTTQAQLGITSRPLPKLSLLANVRYEDREDKTPVIQYSNLAGATSTFSGFYEPRSVKTTAGKVEASYYLPMGFRVVGGVDHEIKERNVPYWMTGALASVATREKTEESTYRIQFMRSLAETVNGTLSYARSNRGGSDYVTTVVNDGTDGSNLVAPLHLADRDRDRWRALVDWMPIEKLSLQFMTEDVSDDYRGSRHYGPRSGSAQNYSIDATYYVSDEWQATAWVSRNETDSKQDTQTTAPLPWTARLGNEGDAVGLGLRGNPVGKLEVGADLQYLTDRGTYAVTSITPIVGVLLPPDTQYRQTRLKLFASYALKRNAGVRLDYAYERWRIDDWTWANWTYLDGTQVIEDPKQAVHFVGVSGYYRWW
jgi:MtrB/PioB family decaheme-associated outer membrane protein